MAIKYYIADPASGLKAYVNNDGGAEENALIVATRPFKSFEADRRFLLNDTYGREMAQDAAFGAGELLIHDGTDTVAWTFSEPIGTKWVADSTDRFHAGAKSLKCDNPNVGDIMQVINNVGPGDDIDMTGNYVALTMWVNVDKNWAANDSFSIYAHVGGALVGNEIHLEDYFDFADYDDWHFINIPLTDMGIESSSIDAFRFENISRDGGKSPKFYIDELTVQASGGSIEYEITPEKGTWLHITAFHTTFVDAGVFTDAARPPYDQFLNMSPSAGYIYRHYVEGALKSEERITNLMDLLSFPRASITNYLPDGTDTLLTVTTEAPIPIILKSETGDKIAYTIEDDFSELLYFRISVQGYVEQRK